jgi:2-dehydro-3-deoxyglucarate aldolase
MGAENEFRSDLEAGAVQFGALATTCTPLMVEVYGDVGFDFAFVDLEHGGPSPSDSERLGDLVRAGETAGIDLLVRLPSGRPPLIRKVLDAGVRNVLVPRVETAEEVRAAAAATRFTYDGDPGERGVGSARATRWGGELDPDYPDRADDAVTFGVMIENRRAVENLASILDVPDLGFALLGHYDLAVSLGAADPGASSVREQVDRFERACRSADVPFGRHVGTDADAADDAVAAGYRLLLAGDETAAVRDRYGGFLADR